MFLDTIIQQDSHVRVLKKIIQENKMICSGLLLYGPQGCGKTSSVNAFIKDSNLSREEICTSTDIDIIQTFCKKKVLTSFKIVFLDESDTLPDSTQNILKSYMDMYKKVYFIFICNYPEKIINSIRSRCYEMEYLPIQLELLGYNMTIMIECNGDLRKALKVHDETTTINFDDVLDQCKTQRDIVYFIDNYCLKNPNILMYIKRIHTNGHEKLKIKTMNAIIKGKNQFIHLFNFFVNIKK
jgi:hypothetical protein